MNKVILPVMQIERSARGLCNVLFDEMELLRRGKVSTSRANAVARIAEVLTSIGRFGTITIEAKKAERLK